MLHRAFPLLSLLLLVGCGTAHGPGDGATADQSAPDASPDSVTPCGGECVEGVCDLSTGACVQCVNDVDCTGASTGATCIENQCVTCDADAGSCADPLPPTDMDADTTPPPPPPDVVEPDAADPDPEPMPGTRPFDIRFATYNVRTSNLDNSAWRDTHVGWDSNDAARMQRIGDEIADQQLTVVSAEEARGNERDAILARLRTEHGQDWGFTSFEQPLLDDTVVLFRRDVWRKVREIHYSIPLQPGLRDRFEVGVLLEHRATGRAVWFYAVHFASGGSDGDAARVEAARRTVASIRDNAVASGRPFVLGGDFNSVSSGPVGDIFRAADFMRYTRNAADALVNNGCKSFNANAGWEGHQQCPGGEASHIDQVWVSRMDMQVQVYRITATARTSRASDHNPLTTILRRP